MPGNVTVTPLTNAKVGVDARVSGGTRQVLVLAVGNVLVGPAITKLFRQPKINDVDLVAPLCEPHQKVVWLHVTMNEVLGVQVLNACQLDRKTV